MPDMDAEKLKEEAICARCIGELYLRRLVETHGVTRKCRYCKKDGLTFTLEEVASKIEGAFERHFTRTATEMDGIEWQMHKDPETDYSWERSGECTWVAIMDAAQIDENAAEDIQIILDNEHFDRDAAEVGEETEFSADAHYEEISPSDIEWQMGWRDFENTIKSEARFFNGIAAQKLDALFEDIDKLRFTNGRPLIVSAGPEADITHLFRARVFQSSPNLLKALERPDRELGSPPSAFATAGRMNATGISVFYGANTPGIALAEVRPPVGSKVAVARFDITRSLRLLDLTALRGVHETGSIFDPSYATRLSRVVFLRGFCDRIARPVMPDDQTFEYLPTQAVADYLATQASIPLDGIIFPSVQAGSNGLNVVLFHKAAKCAELDIPEGTEISSSDGIHTEEEWETWYSVMETLPPSSAEKNDPPRSPFFLPRPKLDDQGLSDFREPALRVDATSIQVHNVQAVTVKTNSHDVRRDRK